MKDTIIKLDNVWRIYKMGEVKVPALRGLNLKINRGEFVAVQGASGSGKSTALNSIGCLDMPTKGKVYLEGK
ncbi:MAG TPA: ATP-binding cassette domain-containing protein, partial [Candidatus Woesearchaeota archaeon]|nr:ATP-binding cassette domain-containing protein [Candidatus Woesearchaeota archaeon]